MPGADVITAAREGRLKFQWADLVTTYKDHRLILQVFRRPAKLEGIQVYSNPEELQQVCDILGCIPTTPKVVDEIHLQAGIQFDAIVNSGLPHYKIVANMSDREYTALLEAKISELGGDDGTSIISCLAKFWVLVEDLAIWTDNKYGKDQAFNYGWFSRLAKNISVTKKLRVYQNIGGAHNDVHEDASQGIQVMWQWGVLERDGRQPGIPIHLTEIGKDPELAPLITHEKKLTVWRFPGIPIPTDVELKNGVVLKSFGPSINT